VSFAITRYVTMLSASTDERTMEKKQTTKKQHYISQGLLRLFSNDGKHIYECMIPQHKVYRARISDAMEENYTYEHPLLEDNTLESAFAAIESSFIPQIRTIVDDVLSFKKSTDEIYEKLSPLLEIFLLFYYRSGAVLSDFCYGIDNMEAKKRLRIGRLCEIITTRSYLKKLANSIRIGYKFSLLYSCKGQFVISDQYIATVALAYKNQFANTSNRAIGMRDTMVLLPLSNSLYVALFNGTVPQYIKQNQICNLTEAEVFQINKIIFHNSFKKCAGSSLDILDSLYQEKYFSYGTTQVFFGDDSSGVGGYTNKKEIFLYHEDEEICTYHIQYALRYRELRDEHGKAHLRNIECPCGSGIKFKACCLHKYFRAFQALEETQKPILQNYHITGCIFEMPIYEFWHSKG